MSIRTASFGFFGADDQVGSSADPGLQHAQGTVQERWARRSGGEQRQAKEE